MLLVLTNQAAYWVVTRLATAAGQRAVDLGIDGAGFSAYNNAYLLWAVPHGIVTVSLVTALIPRMSGSAAEGDGAAVRRDVSYALRTSARRVVPAACALLALAQPMTAAVFQYGRTGADDIVVMAGILTAFAPGLVAFSGQYVLSRAFYALRDTRTPFLLNLLIAGLNAGLSTAAYLLLPARWAVTGMAGAYSLALFAGWALTAYTLHRRLPAARTTGRSPLSPPTPGCWRPPCPPRRSATSRPAGPPGREPWRRRRRARRDRRGVRRAGKAPASDGSRRPALGRGPAAAPGEAVSGRP